MNAPPAAESAVRAAPAEMTALAAVVRPDWDPVIVDGVMKGAREARMPWPQVLVNFPRLMADPQADPRDLLKPRQSPVIRRAGTDPPAEWREARAALDAARDDRPAGAA